MYVDGGSFIGPRRGKRGTKISKYEQDESEGKTMVRKMRKAVGAILFLQVIERINLLVSFQFQK